MNNEKPYWLDQFEKTVEKALDQDKAVDILMVKRVSTAMELKLSQKRSEGHGGWHDPLRCDISELKEMLLNHIDKGDWVDILNFAGMIYVRTEMEKWNE